MESTLNKPSQVHQALLTDKHYHGYIVVNAGFSLRNVVTTDQCYRLMGGHTQYSLHHWTKKSPSYCNLASKFYPVARDLHFLNKLCSESLSIFILMYHLNSLCIKNIFRTWNFSRFFKLHNKDHLNWEKKKRCFCCNFRITAKL